MRAIILSLLMATSVLHCSTSEAKEFRFTYTVGRDKLQYKTDAADWYEAHDRGAQFCYAFFVKREINLTEDKGLEIIDACANPR